MGREIELRTARLLLRSFRATDVDDAHAYRDDAEFARFLPHIPRPFTRADAEASKPLVLREWPSRDDAERAPADGPVQPARIAMHWLAEANAVLQALAAPNRNESIASAP